MSKIYCLFNNDWFRGCISTAMGTLYAHSIATVARSL